jgi:hypothetical protein
MRVPECLMSAVDDQKALGTNAKITVIRSVTLGHKTSDCGASLDRNRFRSNAQRASFLKTSCNRLNI